MASTTCGWCGIASHMTSITKTIELYDEHEPLNIQHSAYTCDSCGRINTLTVFDASQYSSRSPNARTVDTESGSVCLEWSPEPHDTRSYPDVPTHIANAATETTLCLSTGAHRAGGSLARAVIEATAKHQDATGGTLANRIDALDVRQHVKDQAHEIRIFGNDMAHGDFTDPTTTEEAAEILELMDAILDEVYQSPAKLARRKAARLAKKTTTT